MARLDRNWWRSFSMIHHSQFGNDSPFAIREWRHGSTLVRPERHLGRRREGLASGELSGSGLGVGLRVSGFGSRDLRIHHPPASLPPSPPSHHAQLPNC